MQCVLQYDTHDKYSAYYDFLNTIHVGSAQFDMMYTIYSAYFDMMNTICCDCYDNFDEHDKSDCYYLMNTICSVLFDIMNTI